MSTSTPNDRAANDNDFAARLAGMLPPDPLVRANAQSRQGALLIDTPAYRPHLFPLQTIAA